MPPKRKNKNKDGKKTQSAAAGNSKPSALVQQSKLGRAGAAWLRLLRNPCGAPLAPGCYPGANGGIIMRFRTTIDSIPSTYGTSCGYFCPGIYAPNTGSGLGLYTGVGFPVGSGGTVIGQTDIVGSSFYLANPAVSPSAYNYRQPGYGFLSTMAGQVRSVAACVRICYIGIENNRAGTVSMGQTNARELMNVAMTQSSVRDMATHKCRMPDGAVELKLTPTEGSSAWCVPGDQMEQSKFVEFSDSPALFWAVNGAVEGSYAIELTNVVEWLPNRTAGSLAIDVSQAASSHTTLSEVLTTLARGAHWAFNVYRDIQSSDYRAPRLEL